ncbi:MAG: phenylacetate--CoA ligase family protein [Rhodoplanes sp.]|uniref:phenylacetate--CoA ligase family protein n=1 Tax=Rhodoplanes sp. TaxID=1968906 RepID=UPI001844CF0F|nr:phenylacetate--CoA ligase family protein [Rhodoplanes sp.]NVO15251.1 phenylacetate--CoA ligase family protein [Rhodoplanes sp.]
MLHRLVINGLRGATAAYIAYPIAERLEKRDVSRKQTAFAAEMRRPFAERRRRSWDALVDTVRFAGTMVPYYKELFQRIGFDPERLARDERYLDDIPHLTKDVIRAEGDRLLRQDHADFVKHVSKTGGSTGTSAHITYDQEAADWSSAVTRHARACIGNTHARTELHFASKFPDVFPWRARLREHLKCFAMNRYNIFFATFEPDELEEIWQKIRSIRPHLVHAHPSTIYQLALHVQAHHAGQRGFAIFESSGELLTARQRSTIAQALRCDVIDRYGLAEVGVVAYQTDRCATTMTMFDPLAWPEIAAIEADDDLPSRPRAKTGELVLTALKNRVMPLIRYRTGDVAVMAETDDGFVVHEMVGRTHDVIEIGGRKLPTHYIQDVLDRVGGIQQFQIEQHGGQPLFRLVPEPGCDAEGIRQRLAGWWHDGIAVEFVDASALKLQGWRSKFRHLVTTPQNQSPPQ